MVQDALDADGVLLGYHHAYAHAWAKAFGTLPALRDRLAYWPLDRWVVRRLDGDELAQLRVCFDHDFWSTLPAIAGAVDACHALVHAGYDLVCVSAIRPQFASARLKNLRDRGFPIEQVIATHNEGADISPKATALQQLRPVALSMITCLICRAFQAIYMQRLSCANRTAHRTLARIWNGHILNM
ncbi:MAG TPA: HAD family hydrolase [Burkholderiaceae bacterium]